MANGSLRLQHSLELLYLLVRKDLKVRYKSSVLGYVWAIANPFLFAFVYWIAFKFVMRVQMQNYSVFLIAGMFPWVWLSSGVTQATRIFQTNSSLVKKVNLNRAILPLSVVVEGMVHFLFALPVIIVFLAFAGGEPPRLPWVWQVPLLMAVQLLFIYPLAFIFSVANVFVHDVEHLVGVGFMLLFFATPMVYPITMVPDDLRPYFALNPFHALIDGWRGVLLDGTLHIGQLFYCLAWGIVLAILALAIYRRYGHRIGELL